MVFTGREVVEIIITVLALGYIFSGFIRKPKHYLDQLFENKYFDWENVKYSAMIVAPAVILHEFGHKFVGLAFGIPSFYHISLWGLGLGILLRIIGSPFIFFVPGYVGIEGVATSLQMSAIAFAGPVVNLILFVFSMYALKANLWPKYNQAFHISKLINMWLFVFNMLPIPPLDGSKVFAGLFSLL